MCNNYTIILQLYLEIKIKNLIIIAGFIMKILVIVIRENCIKVKREDTKVRDKDFSWKATKKELKAIGREWTYGDPVPPDMRELDLQELQQVAIDWRMLTPIRPKLRQDEEMFSRLVRIYNLYNPIILF